MLKTSKSLLGQALGLAPFLHDQTLLSIQALGLIQVFSVVLIYEKNLHIMLLNVMAVILTFCVVYVVPTLDQGIVKKEDGAEKAMMACGFKTFSVLSAIIYLHFNTENEAVKS